MSRAYAEKTRIARFLDYDQGESSVAQEAYREALTCTEEARCPEDLVQAQQRWTSLYL